MNKKGYTLIELLSTITIMGLIATMASINFVKVFDENEKTSHNTKEKIITTAACLYIELNENKELKDNCLKNSCDITTNTLIKSGLLDSKDVSKNEVIHIYLDKNEKKCILK